MDQLHHFVQALKSDFEKRKKKNSRYSMRAHAQYLGISPATVSRLFSGTLNPTASLLNRMNHRLQLSEDQLVNMKGQLKHLKKQRAIKNIEKERLRKLEEHEYQIISNWYHFAILEMIQLKGFRLDENWIAQKLQLESPETVRDSIQSLKQLKLIKFVGDRIVILDEHATLLDEAKTTEARKNRQRQSLKLSEKALNNIDMSKRDHGALTICLDPSLIPEIKRRIKVFRRSLANFIEKKSRNKTAVYEMQISLFPLTYDSETEGSVLNSKTL